MSLVFDDGDRAFQQEVRDFIAAEYPDAFRRKTDAGRGLTKDETVAWYKILSVRGWMAPAWPKEHGGTGWPLHWCSIFEDELALAGAPLPLPFNTKMLGPILIAFGTEEQQAFYLPRILAMEDWWCQGYSEPGSGSDLAGATTRAEFKGNRWVVNGQKVWTTSAHLADYGILLARTDWAFVHQNPRDGLRMGVSAGGNVGERLMAVGARHYGDIRETAIDWLGRVEIAADRVDDRPRAFSGGMQQRLQIARNLVTGPRLVFMDEPTGGLDVSVQARLLDLLRGLVRQMGLSAVIVTHDLAVVRLLADRLMVMKGGHVVESGLTDQVLDDPQHGYTQLLVSSVLQV